MRKLIAAVGLFLSAALTSPAQAAPYSLKANGVWVSENGLFNGTWEAHFDVAGYDLSGTLNFIGLPGVGEGNIQGTWDLSDIGFGVLFLDQELATFTGGLVGDQFTGNFEAGDIAGTWSGALESLQVSADPVQTLVGTTLPSLVLGRASGKVGDVVAIAANLYNLGTTISKFENLIDFDQKLTPILAKANGKPDCIVNAAINKADTVFEFLPQGCSGSSCKQVRAVVQSLTNNLPIADGAKLYSCKVKINSVTTSGIYQIVASALKAFDEDNFQIPVTALAGQIAAVKSRLGFLGDCHCSTVEQSGSLPIVGLLAPLALLILRRRK